MAGASACFSGRDPAGVPARVSKMAGAFCDYLADQAMLCADPSIETSGPESHRSQGHVFQTIIW